MSNHTSMRRRAIATTSWIAIGVAVACAGTAVAQTATPVPSSETIVSDVPVVGARLSQQTAIDRKKRAVTATDSIVADDVGSFPDRNINEAISRIAGVALGRNAYGEGNDVSIRGNGPDFTRVELDGIGVQSTGGQMAISGDAAGGRGADMRELPSDLIKSVDVIKGSTADMTEGSLGGGIKITTRSGLDFKKPYLSLRLATSQNDLGEDYAYDVNLVASRKFFDNKLGAIFSVTASNPQYNSHQMSTVTSDNSGYARDIDFDNSPEKTFVFNPDTLRGVGADTVLADSVYTPRQIITQSAAAATKQDCMTLFPAIAPTTANINAVQQRTGEQITCLNQWNDYAPSLIRNFINTNLDTRLAADLRLDYQLTDNLKIYAKYAIANRKVKEETRNRNLGGIGIVNSDSAPSANFIDYLNTNPTSCTTLGVGGASNYLPASVNAPEVLPLGTGVVRDPVTGVITGTGRCAAAGDVNYRRGVNANGFFTYNALYPAGNPRTNQKYQSTITRDVAEGATTTNLAFPFYGMAVNVDPADVIVDANHHLTQFSISNGSTNIDTINNDIITESSYMQLGGEYWKGPLRIEFVANRSESEYSRTDLRTSRSYAYGKAIVSVQPSGLWGYELPPTYDETNPANFVQIISRLGARNALTGTNAQLQPGTNLPYSNAPSYYSPNGLVAYTAAQRPLTSQLYALDYSPRLQEGEETSAKVDLTYDLKEKSNFFTRFKTGVSYRNNVGQFWGGGGYTVSSAQGTYNPRISPADNVAAGYVPEVFVFGNNLRGRYRACEARTNTNGTPVLGREECQYGWQSGSFSGEEFIPSPGFQGLHTFTPAELTALIGGALEAPTSTFFDGFPGAEGLTSWQGIDAKKIFGATGQQAYMNLDCMKFCIGSDGKIYEQPRSGTDETIYASYAMVDFGHALPFGMEFDGNVGIRRVQTETIGNGSFTFTSIRKTAAFNPATPTAAAGITTYSLRRQTQLDRTQIDILPTYNLNLWVIPDQVVVRGYTAKTITRPPIGRLLPNGTCTFDERNEGQLVPNSDDELDQSCSVQGNPELKPYTARNFNIAVEWYPNRDTMFSLAWHKLDVAIGGPIRTDLTSVKLFADTPEVDPVTGASLADVEFTVPSYVNGPGFERTGLEFTSKTAFTFLPGLLRYTGADFNYSTLSSSGNQTNFDPITGEAQKPQNEADYYANLSVWYDDGRLNARVSYQARGETFVCISSCGNAGNVQNPPTGNPGEAVRFPYNPGEPYRRAETKFVDAKMSYKIQPNLEVFLEGRNLTKEGQRTLGEDSRGFVEQENLWNVNYGGRRVMFGLVYRYGA